jgi:hypothetical protein
MKTGKQRPVGVWCPKPELMLSSAASRLKALFFAKTSRRHIERFSSDRDERAAPAEFLHCSSFCIFLYVHLFPHMDVPLLE